MNHHAPRITIIGASIVGCATAIVLQRLGFSPVLFDKRAANSFQHLGIGLVLPADLLRELENLDLLDSPFPTILIKRRALYAYDTNYPNGEKIVHDQSSNLDAINWQVLYQQLNKRVSSPIHYNHELIAIQQQNSHIILQFSNDSTSETDFVIFADGIHSRGRQWLFPASIPEFSHYVAWRGRLTFPRESEIARLKDTQLLYGYEKGIGFFYRLPSNTADHLVNTLIYEKLSTTELERLSSPLNTADNILKKHYQALVQNHFPPYAQRFFNAVTQPLLQKIYDLILPAYYDHHCAVIGDASSVLQPVTGSGAAKGLKDALALQKFCHPSKDFSQSLAEWSNTQSPKAKALYELGKNLSNFYVLNHPDWQTLSQEAATQQLEAITQNSGWYIAQKPPSNSQS